MEPNSDCVRHITMSKQIGIVLVLALTFSACGSESVSPPDEPTTSTSLPDPSEQQSDNVREILAKATGYLLRNDTTFGEGHRFAKVFVVDRMSDGTPLDPDDIAAIRQVVASFSPVEFIVDKDAFITEDLRPVVEGSAIITLGPVAIDGDTATVDMEMWCGGLCGLWLTYELKAGHAGWEVLGPVGPIAIS